MIATEIASLGISQHTITLRDPEMAVYETADWDDHDKNLILGKGIAILVFQRAAGEVPAVVRVLEAKPPLADYWSQVVEGWLTTASGRLEWSNENEDKHAITIAPGSYRIRVSIAENGSVEYDGSVGDDHALIELWPDTRPIKHPIVVTAIKSDKDYWPTDELVGTRDADALLQMANSNDLNAKLHGIRGLGIIGEGQPRIEAALSNEHFAIRRMAVTALGRFSAGNDSRANLVMSLANADDVETQIRVVHSLGEIGGAQALLHLKTIYADKKKNEYVHARIPKALAKVGSASVVPLLETMHKNETREQVNDAIWDALVELRD